MAPALVSALVWALVSGSASELVWASELVQVAASPPASPYKFARQRSRLRLDGPLDWRQPKLQLLRSRFHFVPT